MSQEPTAFPMYSEPPRQRGCFFYGCLTCVILLVLGVGGIGSLLYIGYSRVASTVAAVSEPSPIELPPLKLTAEEREKLSDRLKQFKETLAAGKTPEPLVLNSDEVNALIFGLGDEDLSKRVHIEIVGDRVEGRVSLPLDAFDLFGMFGLKGKFLNAKGIFSISLQNDVLFVLLTEAEVKGKPLDGNIMNQLRQDNLAKNAYKDSDNAEVLRKLESVTVKDGKITIKAKPQGAPPAEGDKPKTKEEPKSKDEPKAKEEAKPKDEPKSKEEPKAKDQPKAKEEPKPKDEPKAKEEPKPKG